MSEANFMDNQSNANSFNNLSKQAQFQLQFPLIDENIQPNELQYHTESYLVADRIIENDEVEEISITLDPVEILAQMGDCSAQVDLAKRYLFGEVKDEALAVQLIRQAASQNYSVGQSYLGACYLYGNGVTKDFSKAAELFQLAADQGECNGQYFYALCLQHGLGLPGRSLVEAVQYFLLASRQGHREARINLGFCYQYGIGVERNLFYSSTHYAMAKQQANISGLFTDDLKVKTNLPLIDPSVSSSQLSLMTFEEFQTYVLTLMSLEVNDLHFAQLDNCFFSWEPSNQNFPGVNLHNCIAYFFPFFNMADAAGNALVLYNLGVIFYMPKETKAKIVMNETGYQLSGGISLRLTGGGNLNAARQSTFSSSSSITTTFPLAENVDDRSKVSSLPPQFVVVHQSSIENE